MVYIEADTTSLWLSGEIEQTIGSVSVQCVAWPSGSTAEFLWSKTQNSYCNLFSYKSNKPVHQTYSPMNRHWRAGWKEYGSDVLSLWNKTPQCLPHLWSRQHVCTRAVLKRLIICCLWSLFLHGNKHICSSPTIWNVYLYVLKQFKIWTVEICIFYWKVLFCNCSACFLHEQQRPSQGNIAV